MKVGDRVLIKHENSKTKYGTIHRVLSENEFYVIPDGMPINNRTLGVYHTLQDLKAQPVEPSVMEHEFSVNDGRVDCAECGERARVGDYLCSDCRG
jgi:hypothetical protein